MCIATDRKSFKSSSTKFFGRSTSLEWVEEYKKVGIEPLTDIDENTIFGNDMADELTTITPDGLPQVPSQTVSDFTDTKVSLKGNATSEPPRVPTSADTVKRESNDVVPDKQYTEKDVLFGRGGLGNNHKGNIRYRELVKSHKAQYRKTKDKQAKTAMARSILHKIDSSGGRFLKYDEAQNKWIRVSSNRARIKISQALRE